jgi:hypothetical protein
MHNRCTTDAQWTSDQQDEERDNMRGALCTPSPTLPRVKYEGGFLLLLYFYSMNNYGHTLCPTLSCVLCTGGFPLLIVVCHPCALLVAFSLVVDLCVFFITIYIVLYCTYFM